MTGCQKLPNGIYPNRQLCEWVAAKSAWRPPADLSPRELHGEAARFLEAEWKKMLSGNRFLLREPSQPVAEELYDRFRFVPPWLPKPLSRMSKEEKNLFQHFLVISQTRGAVEAVHGDLRYVGVDGKIEDDFLAILKAGAAGCVGFANAFYFAQAVADGGEVRFLDVYENREGEEQFHIAVMSDGRPYDLARRESLDPAARRQVLNPMDQWAVSLMNTGMARWEAGEVSTTGYLEHYILRAFELSPDYFQKRYPDYFETITKFFGPLL